MGGEDNTKKGGVKVVKSSQNREDASKGKGLVFSSANTNKNRSVGTSSSSNKLQLPNSKIKSPLSLSKPEVKAKTTTSTSSKTITKTATVRAKTAKKVYTLPGQKHDPPEEREPLRIFYESLSKQIPMSAMAEIWMMEHGLLSPDRAKKAYERKQKRQQQLRMGTPIKSSKTERPPTQKQQQYSKNSDFKTKKRINYSDSDDDFLVKRKKGKW
ncbi:uncharacterized protein LOC131222984 [Magnolia sinica]|uniref:uncharacterized protein LOC131222984 n=1 Tax=Magnolia sinica TaxID=86752 RepID=UPI002658B32C|nr:uncharacterized protein LOC131222984 [Magnolia sinica]XP_058074235.1 uncharacterized protein LOC131222984 [Magnolia sinica]